MIRQLLVGIAAAVIAATAAFPAQAAAPEPFAPVPSLTPAATEELWTELVQDAGVQAVSTAACSPLRAVFYSPTDWRRLATKLAADLSPCAQYYVSVPPLAADKTTFRADEAWRIRALGPAFHALAEVNVTGWTSWVATTGNSWYAAGVEARRRMTAAGYDVGAGDTWALNELSSAVRQGTGNARANMRAFLNGLHDGEGAATRGVVYIAGIGQGTGDLSLYQARLQDWYEDAAFWSDLSRFATDWSQEVYGDVRHYAAAGASLEDRRGALAEYLQHQVALAGAAPASAAAAQTFLAGTYNPLANAAWRYDAAFGWTDITSDLMEDYVSAQVYALRAAGNAGFGFAWSPKNPGLAAPEFAAQTDAQLVRLAAAIADSDESPAGACGASWCDGVLDGAALTASWRTFAAWKPSRLAFTTPAPTLAPGTASGPMSFELQTATGLAYTAGLPVTVAIATSSATAELALDPAGPWAPALETQIASGATATSVYLRDASSGSVTVTATAAGKTATTQTATIVAGSSPPQPPPAPAPLPPSPGPPSGGGGAAPDIAVTAGAAPSSPRVGDALTYTVSVRNNGGLASRVGLEVRLPAQAEYAGSSSDRGPGCTPTAPATLFCDLDFLAGGLVATVRIHAVVRAAGALAFGVTSSAQPADGQPANDVAGVTTSVAGTTPAAAPDRPPALRAVGAAPARVTRRGRVAIVSARFTVGEAARLEARLTPLRTAKPLALLPQTTLAGTRSAKPQLVAAARVGRAGAYTFTARVPAAKLVRGRTYAVRVSAVDTAGQRRALTIRVRA